MDVYIFIGAWEKYERHYKNSSSHGSWSFVSAKLHCTVSLLLFHRSGGPPGVQVAFLILHTELMNVHGRQLGFQNVWLPNSFAFHWFSIWFPRVSYIPGAFLSCFNNGGRTQGHNGHTGIPGIVEIRRRTRTKPLPGCTNAGAPKKEEEDQKNK